MVDEELVKIQQKQENQKSQNKISAMKLLSEELLKQRNFKETDLVVWKKGLQNKGVPKYGEPIYVIKILKEAVHSKQHLESAGTSYFREPLDLIGGYFDTDDNTLIEVYYDSRRFEKYIE